MKDYRTEVIVKKLPVSRLVTYLDPKTSNEACKNVQIITMTGPVRLVSQIHLSI